MLEQISKYFIKNNANYIFYENYHYIMNKLLSFEYQKMKFEDSNNCILNLNDQSMYWWNDHIECIVKYTKRKSCKPLTNKEKLLLENTSNIVEMTHINNITLDMLNFSGLSNASDQDWGTLKKYGESLIPRNEWNENQKNFYGFESDADYIYLIKELFESKYIKAARHHTWTGRYYFYNSNKSHRLAALYRQDSRQKRNTKINIALDECKLNSDCARIIYNNFFGIITTGKTYSFLMELLKHINITIILEEQNLCNDNIYILWIDKVMDELLLIIIKFIEILPSDECYLITNILKKYDYIHANNNI